MQNQNDDELTCYELSFLQDATNFQEAIIMCFFSAATAFISARIYRNFKSIYKLKMINKADKEDLLYINRALLISIVFQFLAYTSSVIFWIILESSDDLEADMQNWYIADAITYYILSLTFIASLYVVIQKSSIIWLQLLQNKLRSSFLNKYMPIVRQVSQYYLIEILITICIFLIFLFYILCSVISIGPTLNLIMWVISMIILTQFVIVAYYFRKHILSQTAIPQRSRQKVQIIPYQINLSVIVLFIAVMVRIVWNISIIFLGDQLRDLKDFNLEIRKDNGWGWFIYLVIYVPIANIVPIYFLYLIYQPFQGNQSKEQTDIEHSLQVEREEQ